MGPCMSRGPVILFRILFFVYLAGVLLLCFGHFESMPKAPHDLLGIPMDKVVHFFMFLPFPFLAFLAFDRFTETFKSSLLFTLGSFFMGFLLALGTELGQARLTEHRSGDPWDLLADMLGILLGCLLVLYVDVRKQKKA